jgi:cytochrome b561
MTRSAPDGVRTYNGVAKTLHWALAVLIVLQLGIGAIMPEIHKDTRPDGEIAWHLSVGVLIVLLVAARVVWRFVRPPTGIERDRGWTRRLASATHFLLYALMIIVPLLGWANASSRDWVVGIGRLHLPSLMPAGSHLGHELGDIHGDLAVVLAIVIGLHVLAGLYHQFVRRDDTLLRIM